MEEIERGIEVLAGGEEQVERKRANPSPLSIVFAFHFARTRCLGAILVRVQAQSKG